MAFGEDQCRAKVKNCPQNLAAFRNVGLSLLRLANINAILSTLRDFASRPYDLLKFLCILKH